MKMGLVEFAFLLLFVVIAVKLQMADSKKVQQCYVWSTKEGEKIKCSGQSCSYKLVLDECLDPK